MRKRKSAALEFEVGELNLVPYMDIMVNLIIFMLFTMTGFVQMKVINVSVPAISDGPTEGSTEPTPPPEKKLAVVLAILENKGFIVSLSGQYMLEDGSVVDQLPPGAFTVPVTDGKMDDTEFKKLTEVMVKAKAKDPSVTALTIVPQQKVDYNTLVKVMDAVRRTADGTQNLYPDVLLGVAG